MPVANILAEGLRWVDARLSVELSPAYLGNARAGICEQLGGSMLRYSASLGGVALMYDRLTVRGDRGVISSDSPVIFVPVEVRLLVFAPEIGQELDGKVARHGSDHLALLVHGLINVTIPLQTATNPDAATGGAADGQPAGGSATGGLAAPLSLPAVGESVRFVVRAIHVSDGLLTVLGEVPGRLR